MLFKSLFHCLIPTFVFIVTKFINGEIILTQYLGKTNFADMVCAGSEKIFAQQTRSRTGCTQLCTIDMACYGVFYNTETLTCTVCRSISYMEEQIGTTFMLKLKHCDPPGYDYIGVGELSGTFPNGYRLTYWCIPCTYFPLNGTGVITCKEDGSWTTPTCVYGPDLGILSNGQVIPTDAKGCQAFYSSNCLAYSDNPHVEHGLRIDGLMGSCWCDLECCWSGVCCFDTKC